MSGYLKRLAASVNNGPAIHAMAGTLFGKTVTAPQPPAFEHEELVESSGAPGQARQDRPEPQTDEPRLRPEQQAQRESARMGVSRQIVERVIEARTTERTEPIRTLVDRRAPAAKNGIFERRPAAARLAAGERDAGRESGDVEIHIGRIEVIASRPAPVAQPRKQDARKSPSLDEYLKRGRRP
ncbi:MAG TPA: hypothetical protein VG297_10775 [Bryobacteraceae bacterium]|nr:hypothetical protein [Bryobacteraceae bacterium]